MDRDGSAVAAGLGEFVGKRQAWCILTGRVRDWGF